MAAAVLAVLGEDFSFIPGILQRSGVLWNAQFFAAPTVYSLYFLNPMVAAHGLLFTSLLCLQHSVTDRRWGWTWAASLCSVALIQTKISIFLQLVSAYTQCWRRWGARLFSGSGLSVSPPASLFPTTAIRVLLGMHSLPRQSPSLFGVKSCYEPTSQRQFQRHNPYRKFPGHTAKKRTVVRTTGPYRQAACTLVVPMFPNLIGSKPDRNGRRA